MSATSRRSVALICVIFLAFATEAQAAQRTALVIGNGGYEAAPLSNPVNDAADMARVLRDLGFEVIVKTDASRRDMILAVDQFARKLQGAEVGLFYFAGHGMQIHGRNYLIPVRSHVSSESDVQFEAMDAGRVLGKMQEAGNKLNIVILDACRDNPFKRSFRTENVGLAQMDAPKGTIIAYATSPGSVAADGAGRNGTYTKHLLKNLMAEGLSVQDIFMETGIGVMRETADKQVPWISSTPVSRYFLAGKGSSFSEIDRRRILEEQAELERVRRDLSRQKEELEIQRRQEERVRKEAEIAQKQREEEARKRKAETDLASRPVAKKIKLLDAPVESFHFFEASHTKPTRSDMAFRTRFDRNKARYIFWCIQIPSYFNLFVQKQKFVVDALWYDPDGKMFFRDSYEWEYDPSRMGSTYYLSGWGSSSPGSFRQGRYRVDLFVLDEKIASNSFEVF